MKVFLDTQFETDWARGAWANIATAWALSDVQLMSDHASADAVLVTLVDPRESYLSCIDKLKDLSRRRPNVFVFDTSDAPAGLFPGMYASLRRTLFSTTRHKTCSYLASFNEFI